MAKRGRSFYLTDEAYKIIDERSNRWGISNNAAVERVLREHAEQTGEVREENRDELVEALRDEIANLRREGERRDTIIMALTQRVPEMMAAEPPSVAAETPATYSTGSPARNEETGRDGRSWWRRWMGG